MNYLRKCRWVFPSPRTLSIFGYLKRRVLMINGGSVSSVHSHTVTRLEHFSHNRGLGNQGGSILYSKSTEEVQADPSQLVQFHDTFLIIIFTKSKANLAHIPDLAHKRWCRKDSHDCTPQGQHHNIVVLCTAICLPYLEKWEPGFILRVSSCMLSIYHGIWIL